MKVPKILMRQNSANCLSRAQQDDPVKKIQWTPHNPGQVLKVGRHTNQISPKSYSVLHMCICVGSHQSSPCKLWKRLQNPDDLMIHVLTQFITVYSYQFLTPSHAALLGPLCSLPTAGVSVVTFLPFSSNLSSGRPIDKH